MEVYRIVKASYVKDLSGSGAKEHGGRWNHKGAAVVYASESRSLATLEYLVHVPMSLLPAGLCIATIFIPDDMTPTLLSKADLPPDWRSHPAPLRLADIGTSWIKTAENLLLRVPSAIVEQEFNILINPAHRDMAHVSITSIDEFRIDDRLLR